VQSSNQPTAQPTKASPDRSKLLSLGLLSLIILVLAVAVVYHRDHNKSGTNSSGPYKFTYSKLESFVLTGQSPGSGLAVSKPREIGAGMGGAPGSEATIYQTAKSGGVRMAALAVSSEAGVGSSTSSYAKLAIQSNLANTSSAGHQLFVQPAEQLIKDALDSAYGFSFSSPRPYTNPNIKSDAWRMDFTASATAKSGLPKMQGAIIVALTSKNLYDFEAAAVDYNWNNNQAIWQQVMNSVKIDQ